MALSGVFLMTKLEFWVPGTNIMEISLDHIPLGMQNIDMTLVVV